MMKVEKMDKGKANESGKEKFVPKENVKTPGPEANEDEEANESHRLWLQLEEVASFRSQCLMEKLVADAQITCKNFIGDMEESFM